MIRRSLHHFAIILIAIQALYISATAAFATETVAQASQPLQTVAALDTTKYMGQWYEVARFPNRFQTQCAGQVNAVYTLLDSGRIEVANSCKLANGQREVIIGQAKPGKAGANTQLLVSFLPPYLRWLPIGWGDYWVIDLASDYRYAVVADPSRSYLWLLSRSPSLAADDRSAIEARLKAQGFDVAKLQNTPQ